MEIEFYIHASSVVDEGAIIGQGSKVWHFCHISSGSQIGKNCILGQNVLISPGVILGNGVKIQNNVSVYTGVTCEDDVFLGPSCVLTNVINPRSFINRKDEFRPTLIRKGATIGANATVICGVTIGQYALIGAGTVVTKNVPDFGLFVGNPGHLKGWVSRNGHRLSFESDGIAHCPETGERYQLNDDGIVVLLT
jgi:UDP-2-acetamido-3-amino-2,3-dideoxy-glucuronate N-acetyltransferase